MTDGGPEAARRDEVPHLDESASIVVIGAGPAGLTAAYQLAKAGRTCTVVEADDVVGGISRTVVCDGYRFDIGGHRFFSKVESVEELWREILPGTDLMTRSRSSRIYYRGRFYDYPIRPLNALRNLGPIEAARCVLSYLWARVRPPDAPPSLERYVVENYGWRLYSHFFKTYTEKVWGMKASDLSADWGAQRIKGMSLWTAVSEPLRSRLRRRRRDPADQVTSLIETFLYPRLGPGMMWERCAELVEAAGSKVLLGSAVSLIERRPGVAIRVHTREESGAVTVHPVDELISSMPLGALVRAMDPPAPAAVAAAADDLRYRGFLAVALVVPEGAVRWTDNWIYIHDPEIKAMRVQNFRAWSPYLVKPGHNVLGLEYTATEGDDLWELPDEELVGLASGELERLGLVRSADVSAGFVVRMPKAYPIYDEVYQANVQIIRSWLAENTRNIHPVGRNGMHRYNNQDHSMYTAMLTVENLLHGTGHDIWAVNVDALYHEEHQHPTETPSTGRDAPILPRTA